MGYFRKRIVRIEQKIARVINTFLIDGILETDAGLFFIKSGEIGRTQSQGLRIPFTRSR